MSALSQEIATSTPTRIAGYVLQKDEAGEWGVIKSGGHQYHFHLRDLPRGTEFHAVPIFQEVTFVAVDLTAERKALKEATTPSGAKRRLRDKAIQIQLVNPK